MLDHISVLSSFTEDVVPDSSPSSIGLMFTGFPHTDTKSVASVGGGFGSRNGHSSSFEDAGKMGCSLLPTALPVQFSVLF